MNPSLSDRESLSAEEAIGTICSNAGKTLKELSADRPLLVTFLRHSGCTFCREALSDVAARRAAIEQSGTGLAFVHMSTDTRAQKLFSAYGLADVPRFSDPQQVLYRAFELKNGSFRQLLGPGILWRGMTAALRGHGLGVIDGNGLRLPGVFLLHRGRILRANRLRHAAERPDYQSMACPVSESDL